MKKDITAFHASKYVLVDGKKKTHPWWRKLTQNKGCTLVEAIVNDPTTTLLSGVQIVNGKFQIS